MSVAFGMDGRFTHVAHRREFGYFVVTTYVDCINLSLPLLIKSKICPINTLLHLRNATAHQLP